MLEGDAIQVQRFVDGIQRPLGDLFATLNSVVAVHQHLRFDDRHQAAAWQIAA